MYRRIKIGKWKKETRIYLDGTTSTKWYREIKVNGKVINPRIEVDTLDHFEKCQANADYWCLL